MSTRITIDQLEKMKTHELAELLANVVLLLRRMPNVECRDLVQQPATDNSSPQTEVAQRPLATPPLTQKQPKKKKASEPSKMEELQPSLATPPPTPKRPKTKKAPEPSKVEEPQPSLATSSLTAEELNEKTVTDLKQVAKELSIPFPAKIKKDDLISKILARTSQSHSEQYAIQYL